MIGIKVNSEDVLRSEIGLNTNKKYFKDTTLQDTANVYTAIQILTDTEFEHLSEYLDPDGDTKTDLVVNELSGIEIPAGVIMVGYFTDIKVKSGVIKAFSFNKIV